MYTYVYTYMYTYVYTCMYARLTCNYVCTCVRIVCMVNLKPGRVAQRLAACTHALEIVGSSPSHIISSSSRLHIYTQPGVLHPTDSEIENNFLSDSNKFKDFSNNILISTR